MHKKGVNKRNTRDDEHGTSGHLRVQRGARGKFENQARRMCSQATATVKTKIKTETGMRAGRNTRHLLHHPEPAAITADADRCAGQIWPESGQALQSIAIPHAGVSGHPNPTSQDARHLVTATSALRGPVCAAYAIAAVTFVEWRTD